METTPTSTTLGQLLEAVSRKKSEVEILKMLVTHLQVNYVGTDSGSAEMRLFRDDHAQVPETHVEVFIADLASRIDALEETIKSMETSPLSTLVPPVTPAPETIPIDPGMLGALDALTAEEDDDDDSDPPRIPYSTGV